MRRLALVEPSTGSTTTTMSRSAWCRPLSSLRTPKPASSRTSHTGPSATRSRAYCPTRSPGGNQSSMPASAFATTSAAALSTSRTFSACTTADGTVGAVSLRAATPDDVPEILALIRELAEYEKAPDEVRATEDDVHTHLFGDRPAASVLIAEVDGSVAGFALWYPTYSTWVGRPGI